MTRWVLAAVSVLALAGQRPIVAQTPAPAAAAPREWIARSNAHARILIDVIARLSPEGAGRMGVDGLDEAITDYSDGFEDRVIAANRNAAGALRAALTTADDPQVRQDLAIMIEAAEDNAKGVELSRSLTVPFYNVGSIVFNGVRALLDDQVPAARRPAALVRLRKYIGVIRARRRWRCAPSGDAGADDQPGLRCRRKPQVERGLADSASFVDGMPKLFEKYQVAGSEDALRQAQRADSAYDDVPADGGAAQRRATDFRLPPALYAFGLREFGVEIPPEELVKMAHAAFDEIQGEMQAVAASVAKARVDASPTIAT